MCSSCASVGFLGALQTTCRVAPRDHTDFCFEFTLSTLNVTVGNDMEAKRDVWVVDRARDPVSWSASRSCLSISNMHSMASTIRYVPRVKCKVLPYAWESILTTHHGSHSGALTTFKQPIVTGHRLATSRTTSNLFILSSMRHDQGLVPLQVQSELNFSATNNSSTSTTQPLYESSSTPTTSPFPSCISSTSRTHSSLKCWRYLNAISCTSMSIRQSFLGARSKTFADAVKQENSRHGTNASHASQTEMHESIIFSSSQPVCSTITDPGAPIYSA